MELAICRRRPQDSRVIVCLFQALTMRAKSSGGLASQLAGKPLVLMALKHGAGCDDDDEANDEFEVSLAHHVGVGS